MGVFYYSSSGYFNVCLYYNVVYVVYNYHLVKLYCLVIYVIPKYFIIHFCYDLNQFTSVNNIILQEAKLHLIK